jgi:hypothetical protein
MRSWDVFAFVRQGTYFERHLQNKSLSMLKPLHGLIGSGHKVFHYDPIIEFRKNLCVDNNIAFGAITVIHE